MGRRQQDRGSLLHPHVPDELTDLLKTQAAAVSKLREDTEKHPELQDFDESTPGDGRSAAVSSVGTPMASSGQNGGTKLKLTFNGIRDGYANGVSDDE